MVETVATVYVWNNLYTPLIMVSIGTALLREKKLTGVMKLWKFV